MRRLLFGLLSAGLFAALTAAPAAAITRTYGPDFDHPFEGLIAFYDKDGAFVHRCTGELLAPTVVLTAGHCTDDETGKGVNASARIWFQQDAGARYNGVTVLEDPVTGYPNRCAPGTLGTLCGEGHVMFNYGFNNFAGAPDIHDIGLVILDQRISMPEYATLASPGTLNPLLKNRGTQDTTFLVSGYGISTSAHKGTVFTSFRSRLEATEKLVNLNSAKRNAGFVVQLNGNGGGRGGTCGGDSGGPVFWPANTNQVVAVTSFGKTIDCRGDGFYYRTDRAPVISWILSHAGSAASQIVIS